MSIGRRLSVRRLIRHGTSLEVSLPFEFVARHGLRAGDEVLVVDEGSSVRVFPRTGFRARLADVRGLRGRLALEAAAGAGANRALVDADTAPLAAQYGLFAEPAEDGVVVSLPAPEAPSIALSRILSTLSALLRTINVNPRAAVQPLERLALEAASALTSSWCTPEAVALAHVYAALEAVREAARSTTVDQLERLREIADAVATLIEKPGEALGKIREAARGATPLVRLALLYLAKAAATLEAARRLQRS